MPNQQQGNNPNASLLADDILSSFRTFQGAESSQENNLLTPLLDNTSNSNLNREKITATDNSTSNIETATTARAIPVPTSLLRIIRAASYVASISLLVLSSLLITSFSINDSDNTASPYFFGFFSIGCIPQLQVFP
jgi:hypothetical protein